jgi:hypothetical protein
MRFTILSPIVAAVNGQFDRDSLGEDRQSIFADSRDEQRDLRAHDRDRRDVAVGADGQLERVDRDGFQHRERRENHEERRERHLERRDYERDDRDYERHHAHHHRRPRDDHHAPPGFVGVLMQNAQREYKALKNKAEVALGLAEEPEESGWGAPKDHYHDCSYVDSDCECDTGEVRYGSEVSHSFTHPVMLGHRKSVTCTLDNLRELMVTVPDYEGPAEDLTCQCVERKFRFEFDLGAHAAASLAETDARSGTTNMMCATPRDQATDMSQRPDQNGQDLNSAGSLAQVSEMPEEDVEKAQKGGDFVAKAASVLHEPGEHSDIILEPCDDDHRAQEWQYVMSSGQIRNIDNGLCLTANFHSDRGIEQIQLRDCSLVDSQHLTQRWEVPMYTPPDFTDGNGAVRLAYGSHGVEGVCLSTDEVDIYLEQCADVVQSSGNWHWAAMNGHNWESCASAPDGACNCKGEVRIGHEETDSWSAGVPVGESEVDGFMVDNKMTCNLANMRELSMQLPDVGGATDANAPQCQCRHDPFMDGEGTKDEAEERDIEEANDEDLSPHEKKKKDKEKKKGNMMPVAAAGGLLVVMGAAGFFFMSHKAGAHDQFGDAEYEEEYEEEEYEE